MTLWFVLLRGLRVQVGLIDVRTGAVRDTLSLPADASLTMGAELTGFIQYPSIYALDGPGRARLVGTVPRFGAISVSADLKRATFDTKEYRGDAWLTKVLRR